MKKGKIVAIVIAVIIAAGVGTFFLIGFLTQGTIEASGSLYYEPSIASDPEPIIIRTVVGDINIKYNNSITPFYAKVDYDLKFKGIYMIGKKKISDFFDIQWQNLTSDDKTELNIRTIIYFWAPPSFWLSKEWVKVNLTLRTDITYEIDVYTTTGNVVTTIPNDVKIDSLYVETTTGNSLINVDDASIGGFQVESTTGRASIYATKSNLTSGIIADTTTGNLRLNLSNCLLAGDIDAEVTTGGLTFNSYNTKITGDMNWNLETTTGNIYCDIIQNVELGGNIVGDWIVTTGNINIDYIDGLSTVGASFSGTVTTGNFNPSDSGGFEVLGITLFRSEDFLSANYTFIFNLETTTGSINIDGQSS